MVKLSRGEGDAGQRTRTAAERGGISDIGGSDTAGSPASENRWAVDFTHLYERQFAYSPCWRKSTPIGRSAIGIAGSPPRSAVTTTITMETLRTARFTGITGTADMVELRSGPVEARRSGTTATTTVQTAPTPVVKAGTSGHNYVEVYQTLLALRGSRRPVHGGRGDDGFGPAGDHAPYCGRWCAGTGDRRRGQSGADWDAGA